MTNKEYITIVLKATFFYRATLCVKRSRPVSVRLSLIEVHKLMLVEK